MATKKNKKSTKQKIFESFPKIDQGKLLQHAVTLLHEVQKQAEDLKGASNDEMTKLLARFKDSYQDLGFKAAVISEEARKQAKKQAKAGAAALVDSWNKNKKQFPGKISKEVDKILDKVGLAKASKTKVTVKKTVTKTKPTSAKAKVAVKAKVQKKATVKAKAKPKTAAVKTPSKPTTVVKKKPAAKKAATKTTSTANIANTTETTTASTTKPA
ncbi:MAG: hypothetical protein O2897_04820, partial [bacterium]|nr:hypothetical protein [bacterium]